MKTTVLFLAVSGRKFIKFWDDFGTNIQKSHCSVLLPTDTRHVLKFRKDPLSC